MISGVGTGDGESAGEGVGDVGVPLADEAGLSLARLAVGWVLQNPNVSAAIVGATRPEQLQDDVTVEDFHFSSRSVSPSWNRSPR